MSIAYSGDHSNTSDDVRDSSLDWLLLHHRVKLAQRREVVRRLELRPGDAVLDLGCGPGLWTRLLADAVGREGEVVGLDINQGFLAHAADALRRSHPAHRIRFMQGSYEDPPPGLGQFDALFFSQCFCYVERVDRLMRTMLPLLRPGGRLIGRNWDSGVFVLHPMDEVLLSRVQAAVAQGLRGNHAAPYLDNYFGRKMPGLFRRNGLRHVTCETEVFDRSGPADADLIGYIAMQSLWMGEMARPHLDPEEFDRWTRAVDPESPDNIYRSEEFYFAMADVTVTGRV